MRSEGFPFIVGSGVGPVFASCWSCRRRVVVAASLISRGWSSLWGVRGGSVGPWVRGRPVRGSVGPWARGSVKGPSRLFRLGALCRNGF